MPKRDAAPLGAPCWVDLFTSDQERSKTFYGELFGWTVDDPGPDYGGYINFEKDGVKVAGCMRNEGAEGMPDLWSVYLATADLKETADAVAANGGQVVVPPMDVTDLGKMAVFGDVAGAGVGAWEAGTFAGFGLVAEPGAPAWFELHTRDYDAAVEFYRTVFGWETHVVSDTPEFRYTTLGEGEDQQAGVMDATGHLPEGVPSFWAIYFAVEDADATAAKVTELGGTVVAPPMDTPYGRLAELADPTGAPFRIVAG